MIGLVLLALVNLVIGAVGVHLFHVFRGRTRRGALQPGAGGDSASGPTALKPSSDELASRLAALMHQVEGDLSRHAFEVDEISEELAAAAPDDPASIMAAAATMLIANRRLQSELATAQEEIQRHKQRVDELAAELRIDLLTGLANRRSFDEDITRRLELWRRHKVPFSVILMDIDGFKQINDRYGHPVGDAALKWMAITQLKTLRRMDLAARYGGEEFAVILPGTKLTGAVHVAERLRGMIAAESFEQDNLTIPVTVSIGVAGTLSQDDAATIIKRADEALYAAKQQGKNQVFSHDGNHATAIQADRGAVRHDFDSLQQVAEYKGGTAIPPPDAFWPMRAKDISARGISFVCDSPPECKAFVVRLGGGEKSRYMVANVAFVARLEGELDAYCVGCAFVARLESDDALDDPRPSELDASLELAAC